MRIVALIRETEQVYENGVVIDLRICLSTGCVVCWSSSYQCEEDKEMDLQVLST